MSPSLLPRGVQMDSFLAFSWQSPGSESRQYMLCAKGPVGVTSSPPSLLHHRDWDRWYSCQSWRGWASGECVHLKWFSSSGHCCHCCGWDEHSSEPLPQPETMGELGSYCHSLFLEVSTKCFGRWRKAASLLGNLSGTADIGEGVSAVEGYCYHISQRYFYSSRNALVRLFFYFLSLSVSSVSPSLFWINSVWFKYNCSSASEYS